MINNKISKKEYYDKLDKRIMAQDKAIIKLELMSKAQCILNDINLTK